MDSRHLLFSLLWGSELLRDKLSAYFNLLIVGAWLKEDRSIFRLGSILLLEQDTALHWNQNKAACVNAWLSNTVTELCAEEAAFSYHPYFIYPPPLTYAQNCMSYIHVSKARHVDSGLPKYFPVQTNKQTNLNCNVPLV